MSNLRLLVLGAGLTLGSISASALSTTPPVRTVNGQAIAVESLACSVESDGVANHCVGQNIAAADGSWELTTVDVTFWSAENSGNLSLRFALRNDDATAHAFVLSAELAVSPFPWIQVASLGYVGTVLQDLGGDGATLGDIGSPICTGFADGSPVLTRLDRPQHYATGPFGKLPIGVSPGFQFGVFSIPTTSIGLTLAFTLSPGDLATFDFLPGGPQAPVYGAGITF
ncbi:MAG: hypothetical protein NTZ61_20445, partial [Proteobacteria bacterium]|nr:hypothetical protein [Pseudomonadota bacterium]